MGGCTTNLDEMTLAGVASAASLTTGSLAMTPQLCREGRYILDGLTCAMGLDNAFTP